MFTLAEFLTDPRTCPYLGDRPSRLQVKIVFEISRREHASLLSSGVRRFGRSYFHPACPQCRQCISIRVPVKTFRPSRSQRRVLSRNRDVEIEVGQPRLDDERIDLYRRFHREREATRGWPASHMTPEEYSETFLYNAVPTLEFRYRLGGRLVAVAYVDESPGCMNSIFGFHDPEFRRRSLGTFDVLTELAEARSRRKEHLYLGYYVPACPSMAYKRSFHPFQVLLDGRWVDEQCLPDAASPHGGPAPVIIPEGGGCR